MADMGNRIGMNGVTKVGKHFSRRVEFGTFDGLIERYLIIAKV